MRTDQTYDRDLHDRRFGRKGGSTAASMAATSTFASDMKLFALTFAGGFMFMTVYLI